MSLLAASGGLGQQASHNPLPSPLLPSNYGLAALGMLQRDGNQNAAAMPLGMHYYMPMLKQSMDMKNVEDTGSRLTVKISFFPAFDC